MPKAFKISLLILSFLFILIKPQSTKAAVQEFSCPDENYRQDQEYTVRNNVLNLFNSQTCNPGDCIKKIDSSVIVPYANQITCWPRRVPSCDHIYDGLEPLNPVFGQEVKMKLKEVDRSYSILLVDDVLKKKQNAVLVNPGMTEISFGTFNEKSTWRIEIYEVTNLGISLCSEQRRDFRVIEPQGTCDVDLSKIPPRITNMSCQEGYTPHWKGSILTGTGACVCSPAGGPGEIPKEILPKTTSSTLKVQACNPEAKPGESNACSKAAGIKCDPQTGRTKDNPVIEKTITPNQREDRTSTKVDPNERFTGIYTAIGCIPTEPKALVEGIIRYVSLGAGGIAFLVMIFGAFRMITALGNPDSIKAGQDTIVAAVYGLLFIIFSVVLLQVIGVDILGIPGFTR